MGRDLAAEQGKQGFQTVIPNILTGLFFGGIAFGFFQRAAHDGGDGHSGHGLAAFGVAVVALGVFTQSKLDGRGSLDDHIVNIASHQLDGGDLSPDHIGAAGRNTCGGHTCPTGFGNGGVKGVEAVGDPHFGGHSAGGLVAVLTLPAQTLFRDADVGVGIDKTGQNIAALGIQYFTGISGRIFHGSAAGDFSIFKVHVTAGDGCPFHGHQNTVLHAHSSTSRKIMLTLS